MKRSEAVRNALFVLSLTLFGAIAGLGGYYAGGRSDAIDDTRSLTRLADRLIARGHGSVGLGPDRTAILLAVEDPAFARQAGLHVATPPSGSATITQSLSRHLAFDRFQPGISRIRQSGYASGLETQLSKPRILALWLETVEMGRGPKGWMRGFYRASRVIFHRPPDQLSDDEFLRLVAVIAAPARFRLDRRDPALDARVDRIRRLVADRCKPSGQRDIWLQGCARA